MRNNIVELMANPLTPLFATLGRRAVNASFTRQMEHFFGGRAIVPDEVIVTVNEYAYYNGSIRVSDMLKILLGSVGILKRMFTGAVERWTELGRPHYVNIVREWEANEWHQLPAAELVAAVRQLSEAAIDGYVALVSGVIPAAWISEALFTIFYKALIKRRSDPAAFTFLLGFDSVPIRAEKDLFDLAQWARGRAALAGYLKTASAQVLAAGLGECAAPQGVGETDWQAWRARFREHLRQYGHTIYDLDFANPVPADDPAPILATLKMFVSGEGTDPYARQRAAADRREQATQATLRRLRGLRLKLYERLIVPAQRYAPLREDGLADVGLSYPLLRQMVRELGRRLVDGGVINSQDDIFWLNEDEVSQAAAKLDRGQAIGCLSAEVHRRQAIWRAAGRATPPVMLPQVKLLGRDLGAARAARADKRGGEALKGVAASPGRVTATARVLGGPGDFDQMGTGEVLVAAITTPAWTPLFARAAAVVTDVGGPLSHGSVVAREYGIPAVLGTGTATKRVQSGQTITVDGSEGRVYLTANP
jgi:pyruvate,water dikinase